MHAFPASEWSCKSVAPQCFPHVLMTGKTCWVWVCADLTFRRLPSHALMLYCSLLLLWGNQRGTSAVRPKCLWWGKCQMSCLFRPHTSVPMNHQESWKVPANMQIPESWPQRCWFHVYSRPRKGILYQPVVLMQAVWEILALTWETLGLWVPWRRGS